MRYQSRISFHSIHTAIDRGVLQTMWEELAGQVVHCLKTLCSLNQVERLHPECYSGRQIWPGQYHKHSLGVPTLIIRPRRQIQSWRSSVQHPRYLMRFRRWIFPTLPGNAQVDDLEPPGLITSLPTLACLWPIHSLSHKIVRNVRQLLRPQRQHISDCLPSVRKKVSQLFWLLQLWIFFPQISIQFCTKP